MTPLLDAPVKGQPTEMKKKRARVLIVDDHPIVREGLQTLIDQEADLQVCATADGAKEALEKLESAKPDLAIIDLALKDDDGLALIKSIRTKRNELPILVLSI